MHGDSVTAPERALRHAVRAMVVRMTRPWKVLSSIADDQGVIELRQRGDDFLIVIDGRVLMNSFSRSSEEELARIGLADTRRAAAPRVMVAGLGMGFTLRAALDVLPPKATVVVCELNKQVVEWCRGPLAESTRGAVDDPRVELHIEDVATRIATSQSGWFDAILLDLYEGPNAASQNRDDPFYGPAALARARLALRPGGVLGVWSEDPDAPFAKRFTAAGFDVKTHAIGRGGRKHIVYLGTRAEARQR
jgi:spermidine synthase